MGDKFTLVDTQSILHKQYALLCVSGTKAASNVGKLKKSLATKIQVPPPPSTAVSKTAVEGVEGFS